VKPRSSGFRSIEYLTTMLYFVAANSGFLPSSHPPKTTRNPSFADLFRSLRTKQKNLEIACPHAAHH
ncbi:MAG: hypothetical protein RLZ45_380, partial [Verrucomicrobiota bacterium]